jgi:hypothetical protein
MTIQQTDELAESIAQRGKAIYETLVRPQVQAEYYGKIVAIDIMSSTFEIADNSLDAADKLFAHHPEAQIWFVKIGHRAVHRIGYAGETKIV